MGTRIKLHGTERGEISITKVEEPYGEGSEPVASIGISLSGDIDKLQWKIHVPFNNLDEVITALQELR